MGSVTTFVQHLYNICTDNICTTSVQHLYNVCTTFVQHMSGPVLILGTLSKRERRRQHREARKIFLRNPRVLLSISLLWLPFTPASLPERNDGL